MNSKSVLEPPSPLEELHIIRKLGLRPDFFCGVTSLTERGERLAKALADKGVGHIPVFRGRVEDWDSACLRWYGVAPIKTDDSLQFVRTDQPQPETTTDG